MRQSAVLLGVKLGPRRVGGVTGLASLANGEDGEESLRRACSSLTSGSSSWLPARHQPQPRRDQKWIGLRTLELQVKCLELLPVSTLKAGCPRLCRYGCVHTCMA